MAISDLTVPAPGASGVELRLAPLARAQDDSPGLWRHAPLTGPRESGWWDIDLRTLHLADGAYAYEFVVHRGAGSFVVADPYAEELARLSGCRPILHIHNRERVRPPFSWDDELPASGSLPNNHELVICELPMRWAAPGGGHAPRAGPATPEALEEVIA